MPVTRPAAPTPVAPEIISKIRDLNWTMADEKVKREILSRPENRDLDVEHFDEILKIEITCRDAGDLLHISPQWMRQLVNVGTIPVSRQVGNTKLVRLVDVLSVPYGMKAGWPKGKTRKEHYSL